MAAEALALYGLTLILTFGVRIAVQVRRTGSTGVRGLPKGSGPLEWLAGSLFVVSLLSGAAVPVLALLDLLGPIPALDGAGTHAIGLCLAVGGIALTFWSQLAMGDSWRIGVDPDERPPLVTRGPFSAVRNPIYSAMVLTVVGLVLLVPSVLAIVVLVALVTALELQVRVVEEPHLLRTYGEVYAGYATRVGRFVPGAGFLQSGL